MAYNVQALAAGSPRLPALANPQNNNAAARPTKTISKVRFRMRSRLERNNGPTFSDSMQQASLLG